MGKYKIVKDIKDIQCQIQESAQNLFLDEMRETLPIVLQHYYAYLKRRCEKYTIKFIVSLEEEQDNRLHIKFADAKFTNKEIHTFFEHWDSDSGKFVVPLKEEQDNRLDIKFADAKLTNEEIHTFFEHWDSFIESEKSKNNNSISVVIEGDALVLEAYKERKEAKQRQLEAQKKKIDAEVQQHKKLHVLKWTGGILAAGVVVGLTVGGPIGGIMGTIFGVAIGPFIGFNDAPSQLDLSMQTKERIEKYNQDFLLQEEPRLTVVPLKESTPVVEQKLELVTKADQTERSTAPRPKAIRV